MNVDEAFELLRDRHPDGPYREALATIEAAYREMREERNGFFNLTREMREERNGFFNLTRELEAENTRLRGALRGLWRQTVNRTTPAADAARAALGEEA